MSDERIRALPLFALREPGVPAVLQEKENDGRSLREAFDDFHAMNPNVYALLCRFVDEVRARGFKHYGIAALFERIRWHVQIETAGGEFKLNNNHRAFYARLWLAEHEDAPDFFETRSQVSAEAAV